MGTEYAPIAPGADHEWLTTDYEAIDLATRRRSEILCGAIRVIAREGVVAAKLKDIARESGVSLGLIQHYFDTRENLIDAAFVAMMQVISRGHPLPTEAEIDPLQFLYEVNRRHVFGTVSFPERWGFWSELWAASGRSEHARDVAKQIYELWAQPIEAALGQLKDQGRLPVGAEPVELTTEMLALMDGLAIRTLAEPDRFTPERMLRVLNGWTTVQLGVDADEAARILDRIAEKPGGSGPRTLEPGMIAATLIEARTRVASP